MTLAGSSKEVWSSDEGEGKSMLSNAVLTCGICDSASWPWAKLLDPIGSMPQVLPARQTAHGV